MCDRHLCVIGKMIPDQILILRTQRNAYRVFAKLIDSAGQVRLAKDAKTPCRTYASAQWTASHGTIHPDHPHAKAPTIPIALELPLRLSRPGKQDPVRAGLPVPIDEIRVAILQSKAFFDKAGA